MNIQEGPYLVLIVVPKRDERRVTAVDNGNPPVQTNIMETTPVSNKAHRLKHVRLAHASVKAIKYIVSKGSYGMEPDVVPRRTGFGTFIFGKQKKRPAKGKLIKNAKYLTIHIDIC